MKISARMLVFLFVVVSLCLFTSCDEVQDKKDAEKFRGTAAEYLRTLEEAAPAEDTLTIDPDMRVDFLGSDYIVYSAWSMYYQDFFTVYVNRKDSSVMDTYFELYLRDEAEEKYMEVTKEYGLPEPTEVRLPHTAGNDLSGAKVKSMSEFWEYMDGRQCVSVTYAVLSYEEILQVLKALKEENLYAELNFGDGDEAYYVLRDGVYVEGPSAKDGGKMIERREIEVP